MAYLPSWGELQSIPMTETHSTSSSLCVLSWLAEPQWSKEQHTYPVLSCGRCPANSKEFPNRHNLPRGWHARPYGSIPHPRVQKSFQVKWNAQGTLIGECLSGVNISWELKPEVFFPPVKKKKKKSSLECNDSCGGDSHGLWNSGLQHSQKAIIFPRSLQPQK